MVMRADVLPLSDLLDRNARQTLAEGAHDLGVTLSIVDVDGKLLVGEAVPDPKVVSDILHGTERVGTLSIGGGAANVPQIATHLGRLTSALVVEGGRRAHSSRLHMAQLEEANRELKEKNRRLGQLVERLQEADRVKSNFLATVSHELRTPLTSVIGYSEMLLEGIAGELNEEQREYVQTVMEKGDQLLQLITGILDISRMESEEMRLHREPFDLGEVVGIALSTVAPQARRKKVALTYAFEAERIPPVEGDRDRIRQVLLNLIGNAIKFTPEGGKVHVGGRVEPDHKVCVWVQDSGIGIAEEHQKRIFDPFYQVDSSSTREYGGTGLGLSIVKRLIEAHGGAVWVASSPGKGATFFFTLPAVE